MRKKQSITFFSLAGAIFAFLMLALPTMANAQAAVVGGELKVWHKVMITFTGAMTSETATPNPFTHYRLDVVFTSPSGNAYKVPGYYAADGNAGETGASSGNKWRVNFPPDEVGEWKFKASFVTGTNIAAEFTGGASAGFFDGAEGVFTVTKNDKTGKDFRVKGKLEYVGEHYLRFRDSQEYFIKAGANIPEIFLEYAEFDNTPTTRLYPNHIKDWSAGDPTWKNGKGKGIVGVVNYLSGLDLNAMYFLTMNSHGDGKNSWPWTGADNRLEYDVSKLDQWEVLFEHFDRKGMMLHLVTTETENQSYFEVKDNGSPGGFGTSRKIYYRELVARFGHHLAITWNVGEENGWDLAGPFHQANTDKQRKDFADRLRALTYYNDPIVIHNGPSGNDDIFQPLLGHPAYSGPALQWRWGNNIYSKILQWRKASSEAGHKWVCTIDEPYLGAARGDLIEWRKSIVWGSVMAGGAGSELFLGAGQDITVLDYRPFEEYYNYTVYASQFFSRFVPQKQMIKFEPDDKLISGGWSLKSPGEAYILYLNNGGSAQITLPAGKYSVQWYNPRSGGQLQSGSVTTVNGGGTVSIGSAPGTQAQDWTVLILNENLTTGAKRDLLEKASQTLPFSLINQNLFLSSPTKGKMEFTLYDAHGKMQKSLSVPGSEEKTLPLKGMEPGVYFVQFKDELGTKAFRFVLP